MAAPLRVTCPVKANCRGVCVCACVHPQNNHETGFTNHTHNELNSYSRLTQILENIKTLPASSCTALSHQPAQGPRGRRCPQTLSRYALTEDHLQIHLTTQKPISRTDCPSQAPRFCAAAVHELNPGSTAWRGGGERKETQTKGGLWLLMQCWATHKKKKVKANQDLFPEYSHLRWCEVQYSWHTVWIETSKNDTFPNSNHWPRKMELRHKIRKN